MMPIATLSAMADLDDVRRPDPTPADMDPEVQTYLLAYRASLQRQIRDYTQTLSLGDYEPEDEDALRRCRAWAERESDRITRKMEADPAWQRFVALTRLEEVE